MEIVIACLRIIHICLYKHYKHNDEKTLKFWALENPASGYLKNFLGKPAMVFEPYEFGDPYTKKTAIWGYFKEPKKNVVKLNCNGNFTKNIEKFKHLKQIPERLL